MSDSSTSSRFNFGFGAKVAVIIWAAFWSLYGLGYCIEILMARGNFSAIAIDLTQLGVFVSLGGAFYFRRVTLIVLQILWAIVVWFVINFRAWLILIAALVAAIAGVALYGLYAMWVLSPDELRNIKPAETRWDMFEDFFMSMFVFGAAWVVAATFVGLGLLALWRTFDKWANNDAQFAMSCGTALVGGLIGLSLYAIIGPGTMAAWIATSSALALSIGGLCTLFPFQSDWKAWWSGDNAEPEGVLDIENS